MERIVKDTEVKPRTLRIYNLEHLKSPPGGFESMPSESPQVFIRAVSKHVAIGNAGLKKALFLSSHMMALPIDTLGRNSKYASLPSFRHRRETGRPDPATERQQGRIE